jgi:hypothetical protein
VQYAEVDRPIRGFATDPRFRELALPSGASTSASGVPLVWPASRGLRA